MRRFFSALTCAALLCAMSSPAVAEVAQPQVEHLAEHTEARAIIGIMFPPAQREQMMKKMLDDIIQPMRQTFYAPKIEDAELKALFDAALDEMMTVQFGVVQRHMPAIFDAMAMAYSNEFSLAELKDIRAFAESPSGTRYLSRSTAIVGDPAVMKVNREMFAASKAASETVLPQLKAKLAAYLEAHPDLAAKLAGPKRD
jgi:hypothetical protein